MHPSLRVFSICSAMEWNHLPVAGGLYDQRPKFLEDIQIIWHIKGKAEKIKQEKREREARRNKGSKYAARRRR